LGTSVLDPDKEILAMNEWFQALAGIQQTLVMVAVFTGTIVLFQFISTLFGLSGDADLDGHSIDFGDIFTIRNGVTFLFGFSLGGLMAYEWGLTHVVFVSTVGMIIGVTFVTANVGIFLLMSRLKSSGNIDLDNAIGEIARVTLTVPGARSGVGKVSVSVQGRLKEYHAITDGEALERNFSVTVVDVLGSQLVVGK
jgi:hypothetical protein